MTTATLTRHEKNARKVARENVARGVVLLDKKMPAWFKKIDLKTLDLSSSCMCVAGQLARQSRAEIVQKTTFQKWQAFAQYVGADNETDFGFDIDGWTAHMTYADLDREWARVIRRKLRDAEAVAA